MDKITDQKSTITKKQLALLIPNLSDTLRIGGTHKISHLLIEFIDKLHSYIPYSEQALQSELVDFINQVTQAHIRNDWLNLADIIQYNIQPLLKD